MRSEETRKRHREYMREWYWKNLEKARKQRSESYHRNKHKIDKSKNAERMRTRYKMDPETFRKRSAEFRKKNHDLVIIKLRESRSAWKQRIYPLIDSHKQGGCSICGESDPRCLDFHHVDPKSKVMSVSKLVARTRNVQAILDEIKKCVVLCANCHRKVHEGAMESGSYRRQGKD